jgi:hypothetical protein
MLMLHFVLASRRHQEYCGLITTIAGDGLPRLPVAPKTEKGSLQSEPSTIQVVLVRAV